MADDNFNLGWFLVILILILIDDNRIKRHLDFSFDFYSKFFAPSTGTSKKWLFKLIYWKSYFSWNSK